MYVSVNVLTNMCIQCPQIIPIITVPTNPTPHPAFAKANGPASKPEPSEALIKFAVERISLKEWII